ncbi:MAG: hypothetical protein A3F11_11960 [Gammaproteobacteria bacterium RIFCSPHIGHO2_12_FULL_37_14]|nr:MAG: hypothetical protein A3F11_11960 [Gammaproteobacteria bacterium RIFCSPHIGHO2_12_FULL_37_14]
MEPKVNLIIVGTFILTLLTSIILMIIWLSSGFSLEKYSTYLVYMTESVTGLTINSTVEYNGVEVGEVSNIKIDPSNPHFVQLQLNIKSTTPITQGTIATLATRGLTNITFVALKDAGKNLNPLSRRPGQEFPIIKSGPSLFTRLDIALGRLAANFRRVNASLQSLLDEQNLQAVKKTLANLDQITLVLKENDKRLNLLLENTSKASQQLMPFMQSSLNTVQLLQIQTLPMAYRVVSNLNTMSRAIAELAVELRQNPSLLIRDTQLNYGAPGEVK